MEAYPSNHDEAQVQVVHFHVAIYSGKGTVEWHETLCG